MRQGVEVFPDHGVGAGDAQMSTGSRPLLQGPRSLQMSAEERIVVVQRHSRHGNLQLCTTDIAKLRAVLHRYRRCPD